MVTVTVGLLTTSTESIPGRSVSDYLGIVSGDAVVSFGPRSRRSIDETCCALNSRFELLESGRQRAMDMVAARANAAGATVVVDVRIEYVPLGEERLLVTAVGTAVRLS